MRVNPRLGISGTTHASIGIGSFLQEHQWVYFAQLHPQFWGDDLSMHAGDCSGPICYLFTITKVFICAFETDYQYVYT